MALYLLWALHWFNEINNAVLHYWYCLVWHMRSFCVRIIRHTVWLCSFRFWSLSTGWAEQPIAALLTTGPRWTCRSLRDCCHRWERYEHLQTLVWFHKTGAQTWWMSACVLVCHESSNLESRFWGWDSFDLDYLVPPGFHGTFPEFCVPEMIFVALCCFVVGWATVRVQLPVNMSNYYWKQGKIQKCVWHTVTNYILYMWNAFDSLLYYCLLLLHILQLK